MVIDNERVYSAKFDKTKHEQRIETRLQAAAIK